MGTRNLTIVKSRNKTKVAQYGQWDGYPTGQGQTIADFLKNADLKKFKKQVNALLEFDFEDKQYLKDRKECLGDQVNNEFVSVDRLDKLYKIYPALERDYGAGILKLIHDGTVTKVHLQEDFKNDGLFCEYYYTLDLDKETISVNGGKEYTFKQWQRKGLMEKLQNKE